MGIIATNTAMTTSKKLTRTKGLRRRYRQIMLHHAMIRTARSTTAMNTVMSMIKARNTATATSKKLTRTKAPRRRYRQIMLHHATIRTANSTTAMNTTVMSTNKNLTRRRKRQQQEKQQATKRGRYSR